MLIVLDPGHGGGAPGAVGPGGAQEKDITLAVVKYLKQELSSVARISLTREVDEYRDLWQRSSLANTIGADYFISVHCNAAVDKAANGTETYVYAFRGKAEEMARQVQFRLVKDLKTRDRGVKAKNLHVLRETKMPAILVELAFISNPAEEKLLVEPAWQRKAARAIAQGVADYLGIPLQDPNEEKERTPQVVFEGKVINAEMKGDKAYVEVRELCKVLGFEVIWHAETKTAEVKRPK